MIWQILSIVFIAISVIEAMFIAVLLYRRKVNSKQYLYLMIIKDFDFDLRLTRMEASAITSMINAYVFMTGDTSIKIKEKF